MTASAGAGWSSLRNRGRTPLVPGTFSALGWSRGSVSQSLSCVIGFMIYIPFIVIDMIVASTLMSMGMMMLPPTMISLPFKLLLFVMVDGWHLLIKSLVMSFN